MGADAAKDAVQGGHALVDALKRVRSGDFAYRLDTADMTGEALAVALAFNEMAGSLEQASQNLSRLQRIEESNRILQTVLDTIPVRVFWKDRKLRYLGCNDHFARDAGRESPREMIGQDDYAMGWRQNAEAYRADDARVMASGTSKLNYEEPQTTPEGDVIWLRTSKIPLKDEGGEVFGVLGTYEDITERKLAETELRARERELAEANRMMQMVLDTIPVRVFWKDLDSRFLGCNRLVAQDAGFRTPVDLVGKSDLDMPWAEQGKAYRADDLAVMRSGAPKLNYEECLQDKDGHTFYIRTSKIPLQDAGGRIIGVLGTWEDITERKRAESDLIESKKRFETLAEASPSLVWQTNSEGQPIYMNKRWKEITGRERPAPRGDAWTDTIHEADCPEVIRSWREAVAKRKAWDHEFRFMRADGQEIWVISRAVPILDAEGALEGHIGVCVDISDRKDLERRQRMLMDELDHRVKNNLASVLSLIEVTSAKADDLDTFVRGFSGRLRAMARTHEALASARWAGVQAQQMIEMTLAPFCTPDGRRLRLSGPDVMLSSFLAGPLSLTFHELATNAAKYGALSESAGVVSISWRVVDDERLEIEWIESDGPAISGEPRLGTGVVLIRGFIEHELEGSLETDFAREGLRCAVSVPLRASDDLPERPSIA